MCRCFLSCRNIKNSSRVCADIALDLSGIKTPRKRQWNLYLNFEINSKHIHIQNFSLNFLIPPWTVEAFSSVAFTSCAVSQCMRGLWQKPLYIYGTDCWWVVGYEFWYRSVRWLEDGDSHKKKEERQEEGEKEKYGENKEGGQICGRAKARKRYKRQLQWPVLWSELGCISYERLSVVFPGECRNST